MTGALVITGASRGIGAATAILAARAGYAVAVNYNSHPDEARAVVDEIEDNGGRALAIRADMGLEADIVSMFERVDRDLGPITGLVNNAGYLGGEHRVDAFEVDRFRRLWDVNVIGYFLCAREAVRRMSTRNGSGGGAIVNVTSMAADSGGKPERVHYATTKGALTTFTLGLAKEVGNEGIRVNAVAPGLIDTHFNDDFDNEGRNRQWGPLIPLGRPGVGDDVAGAIVWLLSQEARYVTGTVVRVHGGFF